MSRRQKFDPSTSEFIQIDDGRVYIKKFEVVGLMWKQYRSIDEEKAWSLEVYFSDTPCLTFYGDSAATIMRAFDLPEGPPSERQ